MSKSGISLVVNSMPHAPGTIRFIFQKQPVPGGLQYRLEIPVDEIDSEVWADAGFEKLGIDNEDTARDWFFWLGHVISGVFDPEETSHLDTVVANNIHQATVADGILVVEGEASPWAKG